MLLKESFESNCIVVPIKKEDKSKIAFLLREYFQHYKSN